MLVKHYFRDHGAVPPMLENQEQFMCSHCPNIYTNKRQEVLRQESWIDTIYYDNQNNPNS